MSDIQTIDQQYSAETYGRSPVVFVKGEGATLTDENGKTYVDFGSGIGVMALGYGNPAWVKAVAEQAAALPHTSNLYYNTQTSRLAAELCRKTGFSRVFLSNSGAEANECMIKVARKWAHDTKGEGDFPIVTLVNGFHGRTVTTVTATGQNAFHKYFYPFTPGFEYAPANDLAALRAVLEKGPCAGVMIEVVQGEGGVKALDADYMKGVQALCREFDTLLLIDEVQTGVGRTGTFFAYEQFGLEPDVVSMAKGIGGGLPIGATLMNAKTAGTLTPGTHGSTFGGNPVACAGARAVLAQIDEKLMADVTRKAARIREFLSGVEGVEDVSGMGLMIGFDVKGKKAADVRAKALELGVAVLTAKTRVRLLPPLTISDEELERGLKALAQAVAEA